jgi:hypothetical protein
LTTTVSGAERRAVDRSRRIGIAVAVLVPAMLALGVRLHRAGELLPSPGVLLLDADSHYQAWRLLQARQRLPSLPPLRDAMIAHPEGLVHPCPPGLALLGAVVSWAAGVAYGPGDEVARVGALLCVVLGALAALVAALLALRLVGPAWAALAGVVVALWPPHIELTRLGRIDPDGLAVLLVGLVVLLYLSAARRSSRRAVVAAVGCGLALGGVVWVSQDAAPLVVLLAAGMLAHELAARPGAPLAAIACAAAIALSSPLCLAEAYRGAWSWQIPSPLQLLLLTVAAAASLWIAIAGRSPRGRTALLVGGSLLLGTVVWIGVSRAVAMAPSILHPLPLLQRAIVDLPPAQALTMVTYLALALPLLVALALAARPRGDAHLLALWGGLLLLLGALRLRFLAAAIVLVAPLAALGIAQIARRLAALTQVRAPLRRLTSPMLVVAVLCGLWPTYDYFFDRRLALDVPDGMIDAAARWIGRHPTQPPGVLAPPAAAHAVLHLGRVPVIGTSLTPFLDEPALRDTIELLASTDIRSAERIAVRRRVGRIALTHLTSAVYSRLLRHVGRPWRWAVVETQLRRSLAVRLGVDSGSGVVLRGELLPAIDWLRLEWETAPIYALTAAQVFRAVPGAALVGQARPGQLVRLELPLVSNRGRPIRYLDFRRADHVGRFAFRVPHWTGRGMPSVVVDYINQLRAFHRAARRGQRPRPVPPLDLPTTTPVGPAAVSTDDWTALVEVSADDVHLGRSVLVVPAPSTSTPLRAPAR